MLWPMKSDPKRCVCQFGLLGGITGGERPSEEKFSCDMHTSTKLCVLNSQHAAGVFLVALVLQVSRFDLSSFEGILVISVVGDLLSY